MSLNIWNDRAEMPARVETAIAGLKPLAPDVICLQEVVDSPGYGNQASRIAAALGMHAEFDAVDDRHATGPLGNAVVTRYPVLDRASVQLPGPPEDPRRALLCRLDTPHGVLAVVSCHLSWELWESPRREDQVVALDRFVKEHGTGMPPIICGDFNTVPDSSVIRFMTGKTSLSSRGTFYRDTWARRHPHDDGYTWSDRNPHTERWVERNRRIDYVFVGLLHPSGWGAVLDARVVLDLPGPTGHFASDHFGVYAEIGDAPPEPPM